MNDDELLQVGEALQRMATIKGKDLAPHIATAQAQFLGDYPFGAVMRAIAACADDPDPFLPSAGAILALARRELPGYLAPDDAWMVARRLISRYNPYTRPVPALAGHPGVDEALRTLGGVASIAWEGAVQEGYVKRSFLAAYDAALARPEYLAWAVAGAPLPGPPTVAGIEGPEADRARTYARLDAPPAPPVPQLAGGRPLDAAERAALAEEVRAGIARITARGQALKRPLDASDPTAPTPPAHAPLRPGRVIQHNGRDVVIYDDEQS